MNVTDLDKLNIKDPNKNMALTNLSIYLLHMDKY